MKEIEVKIDAALSGKTVKEILFSHLFLTSRLVTKLKSTNGILVMPKDHYIINKRLSSLKTDMKRAMLT